MVIVRIGFLWLIVTENFHTSSFTPLSFLKRSFYILIIYHLICGQTYSFPLEKWLSPTLFVMLKISKVIAIIIAVLEAVLPFIIQDKDEE